MVAVPFDDPSWDYAAYAGLADFVLLMAYDEHWDTGEPGSISGQSWFEETLAERMKALPRERTVVALGNYGYDWSGSGRAESISVPEALRRARDAGAAVTFDPATRNPRFDYRDPPRNVTPCGSWMPLPQPTTSRRPIPFGRPATLCGASGRKTRRCGR